MASEVPPDFDKPWDMSDVVIRTNNSDGKDLHANKTILSSFSPYFRALFCGNFKEKIDASVNVDCDHDVMLEILKTMYQIGFKYAEGQKPYPADMLVKMYRAADRYDFACVRTLCLDQLEGYSCVEMANAAEELELYDIRMKVLMKLTPDDVYKFLRLSNFKFFLSKEEFLSVFQKLFGQPLPKGDDVSKGPLNLEEITEDLKNPRVDLTKPWTGADLKIFTNNAMDRVLYANKALVEMMCPRFAAYLCTNAEPNNKKKKTENPEYSARINEDFVIVKEILSIILACNTEYADTRILHPALLHAMYYAANHFYLNIPSVRNFCVAKLKEHKSVDAFDVLWKLPLYEQRGNMVNSLTASQLRDWIYRDETHLSYRYRDGEVAVTLSNKKRIIWKSAANSLIHKFKAAYFPKAQNFKY